MTSPKLVPELDVSDIDASPGGPRRSHLAFSLLPSPAGGGRWQRDALTAGCGSCGQTRSRNKISFVFDSHPHPALRATFPRQRGKVENPPYAIALALRGKVQPKSICDRYRGD